MEEAMTTMTTAAPPFARTATPAEESVRVSRLAMVSGRIVSGFIAAFLLFDGAARLVRFAPYVEGTVEFGYPEASASWIGLTLVISTVLYVIPRTAVLGAILLTGYLGGATASHVRLEDPWLLFSVAFGVLAWLGLYLRDQRIRALLPLRRQT
jgi:DoxX-like family